MTYPLTYAGAPVIEGDGDGPTLNDICIALGIGPLQDLELEIKGFVIKSARSLSEDIARATRVYRFEEEGWKASFFDTFAEALDYAKAHRYCLIGYDPDTDKFSVDEMGVSE